ncbi:MAG TPA: adenylosuccinate lyase [Candidatus Sumerlaeota bacterium]|nr:adenylosuccinate lyase [Candidatus Sumerlaeota bacterium]
MIQRYTRKPMSDIWTREAQFDAWLQVELAVCDYYASIGRIPKKDLATIRRNARIDVKRIDEIETVVRHDVIAFTTQLAEQIGPASRFVHLGLTSSDVVDTAWGLRMARAAEIIAADLKALHTRLRDLAKKHAFTVMMGRTHGMHAEPTTFGLKVLVWYMEFGRHIERFREATKRACVGKISGAVGTSAHTGLALEKAVCKSLRLGVAEVSTQVVQRDRHAEFLNALALIACSVEKVATEVRHLQRPELRELEEPFATGQKGSSAMPHKRNPVTAEQLTGLARVVRANAIAGMENVALWGERDISHSSVERVVIPDSCQLVDYLLSKLDWILAGLRVNEKRMEQNIWATRGLVFSQKMMLTLVESGMTREDAYAAVQGAAMRSWHDGDSFADELMKEASVRAATTRVELDAMMNPREFLTHVPEIFARCGIKLAKQKAKARKK